MNLSADMLNKPGLYSAEQLRAGSDELQTFLEQYEMFVPFFGGVINGGLLEFHIKNLQATANIVEAKNND